MKFRNPETGEVFDVTDGAPLTGFCYGISCYECPIKSAHPDCTKFINEYPNAAARLMGYEVVEDDNSARTITVEYENCPQCGKNGGMIQNALTGAIGCMECGWTNKKENNMDKPIEGMCCDCVYGGPCCSWEENESCQHKKDNGVCWKPYTREEANMDKPRICEVLVVEPEERFSIGQYEYWVDQNGDMWCAAGAEGKLACGGVLCAAINHPDRVIRRPRFTEQEVERAKAIKVLYPEICYIRADDRCLRGLNKGKESIFLDCVLSWFPSLRPNETVTLDEIIGGADNA